MLISARTQMLSLIYSLDEMLPKFHAAGFDGYEFCLEDKLFHPRPDYLEDYFIQHLVRITEENHLQIGAIGCHLDYINQDSLFSLIKKGIGKTRQFGTDIFIVVSGNNSGDAEDSGAPGRFRTRLRELLDIAQAASVRIALEPEPGHRIDTTDSFLQLWEEMDRHPALYCNFDIGHSYLLDNDIGDSIHRLGDRVAHAHIENMADKRHLHLVPWEGEIDLTAVLRDLQQAGFIGSAAFDYYNDSYESVMSDVADYLKKRLPRAGS